MKMTDKAQKTLSPWETVPCHFSYVDAQHFQGVFLG